MEVVPRSPSLLVLLAIGVAAGAALLAGTWYVGLAVVSPEDQGGVTIGLTACGAGAIAFVGWRRRRTAGAIAAIGGAVVGWLAVAWLAIICFNGCG